MNKHDYGCDYQIAFRKATEADVEQLIDFDCGNPNINFFIRNECLDEKKDVTYLFYDEENDMIIGFCSICCNGISVNASDGRRNFNTNFPAIEIDFFAIDERYRSIPFDKDSEKYDTLSAALFMYMIKHIKGIADDHVGATHVCLYSVPNAVNFYTRCGMNLFENYMNRDEAPFVENCIPMFMVL
ncbi:MAG: hypothetical protein IJF67_13985 [Clostridia bacterium]|nr:hypothetical protein [Clostridia bacterium]